MTKWTHNVIIIELGILLMGYRQMGREPIEKPDDLDEQAMDWLRESYEFSMRKGRKRL